MPGVFELFHLSLLVPRQADMFGPTGMPSREEWLRQAFSRTFKFRHRKGECYWVPARADSPIIAGNVVRSHQRRQHKPPEEGGYETISNEWQGAMVLIDPRHHDDGQKISFERDETLGKPRAVLQSMIAFVNALPDAPYIIEPEPIFNKSNFWAWAAAHENRLHSITFEFVVPNMFGSRNAFEEDMADLRDIGVAKARVSWSEGKRKDGIDAQSEQVRNGVDYAAEGGGTVTAKAKNGDSYTSTEDTKTTKLPTTSADRTEGVGALTKWFQSLLGRESDDSVDSPSGATDRPTDG